MLAPKTRQFHLKTLKGEIGGYCILPGDPARCELIAKHFDEPYHLSCNREFNIWNGTLLGEKVTACSTGIGGPSAAIAVEELVACGAHTLIRVGTCGGIALNICSGDVVVATGAVRQDGTSREYAPIEFPAVSDFNVLRALADSAKQLGYNYHTGIVQSKDSFYGQHSPLRMPTSSELTQKWEAWKRLGVLASEMEASTLFSVASALGVRAGAVFHVIWNQERALKGLDNEENESHNTEKAVITAINAIKMLIREKREEK